MTTPGDPGGAIETPGLQRARRRARWLLVGSAALGATAMVLASTVAAISARDMLGSTALSGAAGASLVVGVAIGTSALAAVIARRGQRQGLSLGYAIGALGAVLALWAVSAQAFVPLLAGLLLIGFANSSAALSRYASAEMAAPAERASAISLVVWANTIGAIVGPALVPFTAGIAEALDVGELLGPLLATGVLSIASALLLLARLKPDVRALAVADDDVPADTDTSVSMRAIIRRPAVTLALTAMIVGQVVMVVIMAMTPVHMTDHGHGLGAVGIVISGHMLGMFALSPVSGRITDRVGPLPAIGGSFAILTAASVLSAVAPTEDNGLLLVALFLLGYGWNVGFVAGSALLTSALASWERTRGQGFADTLVWGSSAAASLGAGLLLAAAGFAALGAAGVALLAAASVALLRQRRAVSPAPAS
jgi:MFS family permease